MLFVAESVDLLQLFDHPGSILTALSVGNWLLPPLFLKLGHYFRLVLLFRDKVYHVVLWSSIGGFWVLHNCLLRTRPLVLGHLKLFCGGRPFLSFNAWVVDFGFLVGRVHRVE